MPSGFFALSKKRMFDWGYSTEPQVALGGERMIWPRGKVLGGSGSVNAMTYLRGSPGDFDHWAAAGNPGWSYAECLPYFKRAETHQLGESEYHGGSGPLGIQKNILRNPLGRAWIDAARQSGYRTNSDFNGPSIEGFGPPDQNITAGRRSSPASAYLHPIRARRNLTITTNVLVTRIITEGKRATGVELRHRGRTTTIKASREVILTAGAINSPQLLLLSGIGDPATLKQHGISPVHDLRGVGRNLQDHLYSANKWTCRLPVSLINRLRPQEITYAMLRYLLFRSGTAAETGMEAVGFVRSGPQQPELAIQYHFAMLIYAKNGNEIDKRHGFMPIFHVCYPKSRGTVSLNSADSELPPAIDPNYLADEADLAMLREGLRISRKIIAQPVFDALRGEEIALRPDADEREINDYLRQNLGTSYHPVGTCKMGVDADAVVDPKLRVVGLDGLRVSDASIMPRIVCSNTQAATIMIAERAADMIIASKT